jgi:DNA-binding CsgD family transcriptional regulator
MAKCLDGGRYAQVAHLELPQDEKLLPILFRTPKLGFAMFDRQTRYLAINQMVSDINGIPLGQHLGKTLFQVLGEQAGETEPPIHAVFGSGVPIHKLVTSKVPSRTEVGQWHLSYFPIRNQREKIVQVAVTVIESARPVVNVAWTGAVRELTSREKDVLKLIANGKLNKQIADLLNISTRTVESYRTRIMYKLGLRSTASLVTYAIKSELVEP